MIEQARQLLKEGRRAEALEAARQAYDPALPETGLLLGVICSANGQHAEAEQLLGGLLSTGVGEAGHWRVLAALRQQRGDCAGEVEALERAWKLAPGAAAIGLHLAVAQLEAEAPEKALETAVAAIALEDSAAAHRVFAEALSAADSVGPEAKALLKRAIAEGWARGHKLFRPALSAVRAAGLPLDEDDLLAELLAAAQVRDEALERELTQARRRYLLEGGGPPDFLQRLASQAYINEYCWAVSNEEAQALAGLEPSHPLRALYEDPGPKVEVGDIPVLTPMRAGISEVVRTLYEESPYPRWVRAVRQDPQPLQAGLIAAFPRVRIEPVPGADILVAGCGTGQHAMETAARWVGASVLAIDLSRASLAYAMRKTAELGVANIAYGQADILELGGLGRTFDVIECVGALHHLSDPAEGLRVLAGILKPGGAMRLGLYSRRSREELKPAMALARRHDPTPGGIRALRQAIMDAPEGDPVRAVLGWGDFYSSGMCRDLLMHVQESQHDLPGIRRMLDENGLRLLGFQVPPGVSRAYRKAYPDDPAAIDLAHWDAFEAAHPQTFRGMYQFWLQKPA